MPEFLDRFVNRPLKKFWRHMAGAPNVENDLVFVTNGSLVENSVWGDHHTSANLDPIVHDGGSWHLRQCPRFGMASQLDCQPSATLQTAASRPDRCVILCSGSIFDVRELIKSTVFLRDREKLPVPFFAKRWVEKTIIGRLLDEYGLI